MLRGASGGIFGFGIKDSGDYQCPNQHSNAMSYFRCGRCCIICDKEKKRQATNKERETELWC